MTQVENDWQKVTNKKKTPVQSEKFKTTSVNYTRAQNNSYNVNNGNNYSNSHNSNSNSNKGKNAEANLIRNFIKEIKYAANKVYTYEDAVFYLAKNTKNSKAEWNEMLCLLVGDYPHSPSLRKIFDQLCENKKFPKQQITESTEWSPFNKWAWWPVTDIVTKEMQENVISKLHNMGFHIFIENGKGENALNSLKQYLVEKQLSQTEYVYRYQLLIKVSSDEVDCIVANLCNKINDSDNSKSIDLFRFCLITDAKISITRFVKCLLKRRLPVSLTFDKQLPKFITFWLEIIKGADHGFNRMPIHSKELELFFKLKGESCPSEKELKNELIKNLMKGFQSAPEEIYDPCWEVIAVLLGEFYKRGEYQEFGKNLLDECLNHESVAGVLKNLTQENKIKFAMRFLIQSNLFDPATRSKMSTIYLKRDLPAKDKFLILDWLENNNGKKKKVSREEIVNWSNQNDKQDENTTRKHQPITRRKSGQVSVEEKKEDENISIRKPPPIRRRKSGQKISVEEKKEDETIRKHPSIRRIESGPELSVEEKKEDETIRKTLPIRRTESGQELSVEDENITIRKTVPIKRTDSGQQISIKVSPDFAEEDISAEIEKMNTTCTKEEAVEAIFLSILENFPQKSLDKVPMVLDIMKKFYTLPMMKKGINLIKQDQMENLKIDFPWIDNLIPKILAEL